MRYKNVEWNLPPGEGNIHRHENIDHGLLMDLRDELQEQNMLMREAVHILRRMDRRLLQIAPLRPRRKT